MSEPSVSRGTQSRIPAPGGREAPRRREETPPAPPEKRRADHAANLPSPGVVKLKDSAAASYHIIWIVTLILLAFGLCMMLSVSMTTAVNPGGDRFGYVRDQGLTAVVGLVLMFMLARTDYRRWLRGGAVAALAVAVFALLAIHIPGVSESEGGAASWIPLGPVTFQPSEFAKLALVMAGAHLLTVGRPVCGDFKALMRPFGLIGLAVCGLVLLEPDLGTAVIIAGLVMGLLYVGGMKLTHWLGLLGAGAGLALLLVATNAERMSRVLSFLDPGADPFDTGFQLSQSLVALGRGGWLGVGPGESIQKFSYLPKAHTDMVFAILGEEFGLLGAGLVILLFALLAMAAWRLARQCCEPMGRYLLAGCGMLVTLQAVVNIGGVIGALPLTGVPLPFMSFGRNSLLVMLIAVGLMLSVARWAPAWPAVTSAKGYENVTSIDRRRRDSGARGARPGVG
jgi:cell division protein FtsW